MAFLLHRIYRWKMEGMRLVSSDSLMRIYHLILSARSGPMKPISLESLWIDELRDLYDAETQLVSELPRLARAVSSSELRERLVDHFNQTQIHMQRLET